jgi:hypothetical protein
VTDIAHRISMLSNRGLATSAEEPTIAGVVTICVGRLARVGCEYPKIERDSEKLERPMFSSRLCWADDDVKKKSPKKY